MPSSETSAPVRRVKYQSAPLKRVAILVTSGFEQSELSRPLETLEAEGVQVDIVSLKKESVKAWNRQDWGDVFHVDAHIDEVCVDDYDALVLPGGVMSPDFLRMDDRAVAFVRGFMQSGKPVAAVCHGPWTLIEADVVKGRYLTSFPSLKTDLVNAGAHWSNQAVVVDGNLITSRRPDDLPEFCAALRAQVCMATGEAAPTSSLSVQ